MVAKNALFAGWSLKKFKATVVNYIWPEVLFFSGVATSESFVRCFLRYLSPCVHVWPVVTLVSEFTEYKLSFSSTMLTVLGTVLGLVIHFRTSSAYER